MNGTPKLSTVSQPKTVLRKVAEPYVGELGVISVDADVHIEGMNPAASVLLRVKPGAFVHRPLAELMAHICGESDAQRIVDAVNQALLAWRVSTFELQLLRRETVPAFVKLHVSAIRNGEIENPSAVLTLEDITALKQLGLSGSAHENARRYAEMLELITQLEQEKEEYRLQSIHDGLTGLYNYAHFQVLLADEIARARRYGHPLSLLLIDVDDFKAYNDAHGHLAGNAALRNTATIFQRTCRQVDRVARYGGEEFTVILPETSEEEVMTVAERMRRTVEYESRAGMGFRQPLTVSIGIASYPRDTDSPMEHLVREELVLTADERLYRAKAMGKNNVCVLDGD